MLTSFIKAAYWGGMKFPPFTSHIVASPMSCPIPVSSVFRVSFVSPECDKKTKALLLEPTAIGTMSSVEKDSLGDAPPKFSTPDHPSVKLLEKLRTPSDNPNPPPYTQTNPHDKPDFAPSTSHTTPILYLPPLISSLPKSLPPIDIPHDHPPLTTETRLPDIDPVSLSLHKALHYFRPYDDKYASKSYAEAFNWSELNLPLEEEREWYCVAFRSRRKAGSDGTRMSLQFILNRIFVVTLFLNPSTIRGRSPGT